MTNMFPDLEAVDLGSVDGEHEDVQGLDDDDEPQVAAPPPAAEPRRRGRPPKPKPESVVTEAPEPVPTIAPNLRGSEPETPEQTQKRFNDWRKGCPKDFNEGWSWCVEHCGEMGWEPRDLSVGVIKLASNEGGPPQGMKPRIQGEQIAGNLEGGYSPGDAADDWIIDFYHRINNGGRRATYKGRIYGPARAIITESDGFTLEDIDIIDARRKALKAHADKRGGAPTHAARYEPPQRPWAQPAQSFQQQQPLAAAPAPPGVPPEVWLELGSLRQESARARAEGRPPNEIPPPAAAPVDQGAVIAAAVAQALEAAGVKPKGQVDIAAEIAKASAAAVAQALELAGIKPKTEADAQREREVAMMAQFSALLEARLGPAGAQPAGAVPVGAAGPAPTMADIIKDAAARKKQAEDEILAAREVLGVPVVEPKTEIVEREDDEGADDPWYVKIGKGVAQTVVQDPMGTLAGLAGFAAPFVEGSALGGLIAKGVAGAAEAAHAKKVRDSVTMPGTGVRKGGL